jgi:ribonuclease J
MTSLRAGQGMRVCIHRGAREIGGSCVELEAFGQRLVLDLGLPLDADFAADVALPDIPGLRDGAPSLVGLVISHGHPDHWGLAERIHPNVPVFIGEATSRILREATFFTPMGAVFEAAAFLRHGRQMQIGPFHVTPYLVDHSAFDAYALQVEACGKRLLYSGDFRAHGRRASTVEALIDEPPSDIDVLLLEGTHVRERAGGVITDTPATEHDVEDRCAELFARTEGIVLAAFSPQNVDRMITLHRAAQASGRQLVLDLYGASVASAIDDSEVPRLDADDVLVYIPQAQRVKIRRSGEFDRVRGVRDSRIFGDGLAARAAELVLTFRSSMIPELERAGCLSGAAALWSMWAGYLQRPNGERLVRWLKERDIPLEVLHASGHASVADLQRFALAIDATQVVPIHTARPERFAELFSRVATQPDGTWWEV